MATINNNVAVLSTLLYNGRRDPLETIVQEVIHSKIKASAIVSRTVILIFSPSLHLASYVKNLYPDKRVYAVCLGTVAWYAEVLKAPYQTMRYAYYVNALYTITCQLAVMRQKQASFSFDRPVFFVDTEFGSSWETIGIKEKKHTIYDIAIINGFEPYSSIVSYVSCLETSFEHHIKSSIRSGRCPPPITFKGFNGSPTIEQIHERFCMLIDGSPYRPTLYYYHATRDISFIVGNDLDRTKDYGIDLVNALQLSPFNNRGTLSENYDRFTASSHKEYSHLLLHTAVSDTVLLMELMRRVLRPAQALSEQVCGDEDTRTDAENEDGVAQAAKATA
jgi:hypothetical protein